MEAFAIRNKATGEWWTADSGKRIWVSRGAAKNAWVGSQPWDKRKDPSYYFDGQTEYEIVRLVPEERN